MTLSPGTRLGPYEVTAQIGEGGMGEVYRATDTNLKRSVAIKVLPESVAADRERLARFQREAEVLAALNHPNIAAIYGLERSGATTALVMELVEGPTLADRIAQGLIPIDEALPIAKQIAEALEAAHEQGIIHRDLKPANIKVRPDGTVKVLDFGLAKALEPTSAMSPNVSQSPTITSPAMMTGAGVLLGTAAYMSPEQARGKAVDKRSDIWAFGCVLYEMLTRTVAFPGSDVAETSAAILRTEPDWNRVPAPVRPLIRRCLQKDARNRLRDIGDARVYFEDFPFAHPEPDARHAVASSWQRRLGVSAALASVGLIVLAAFMRPWVQTPTTTSEQTVRFAVMPTPAEPLFVPATGIGPSIALAADGSRFAYRIRTSAGDNQLMIRSLDGLDAVRSRVNGQPFISPDGRWVGFFTGEILRKVPIDGGPAVTLATVSGGGAGASWGPDDTIVYANDGATAGLFRVPAAGGEPQALTIPDPAQGERDHLFPSWLPEGSAVLFTVISNQAPATFHVELLDLRNNSRKVLVRGGSAARFVAPGYLVYAAGDALRAIRFDWRRQETVGESVSVVEGVTNNLNGGAEFDLSRNGTLLYMPRGAAAGASSLVWIDRSGREEPLAAPPRGYGPLRISPDGRRFVTDIREEQTDIWTWDFERQTLTRLTFDPAADDNPIWTPDGQSIIFRSARDGTFGLYRIRADGTGVPERLKSVPGDTAGSPILAGAIPKSIDRAANMLVVQAATGGGSVDIFGLALGRADTPIPLISSGATENQPDVSPDGKWLAYQSGESGQFEIYVRPLPSVNDGRWQVSPSGGTRPVWSRDGTELFYTDLEGTLTVVSVGPGSAFNAGKPVSVFKNRYDPGSGLRSYDVSPDGRFLMVRPISAGELNAPFGLVVVVNWVEELKRRLPVN